MLTSQFAVSLPKGCSSVSLLLVFLLKREKKGEKSIKMGENGGVQSLVTSYSCQVTSLRHNLMVPVGSSFVSKTLCSPFLTHTVVHADEGRAASLDHTTIVVGTLPNTTLWIYTPTLTSALAETDAVNQMHEQVRFVSVEGRVPLPSIT